MSKKEIDFLIPIILLAIAGLFYLISLSGSPFDTPKMVERKSEESPKIVDVKTALLFGGAITEIREIKSIGYENKNLIIFTYPENHLDNESLGIRIQEINSNFHSPTTYYFEEDDYTTEDGKKYKNIVFETGPKKGR